ncbi:RNA deprotection pyrophosphohydrolase [Salinicoccus bachuensis]|uniref:RNA deprotection pyrophosphohydrolase n=1 Tax=Salinicoccus bachuensis TaxID=3136731 RepID=A0ABZ3CGW9_9STAP
MLEFKDRSNRKVTLEFEYTRDMDHILAICVMDGKYLFTDHKVRGIEFPGGKIEPGESAEEAVHREVFEETGASIGNMRFIGVYTVHGSKPFVKGVYLAEVADMFFKCEYMETYGPVLYTAVEDIPEERRSFLLADPCIDYLYRKIRNDDQTT